MNVELDYSMNHLIFYKSNYLKEKLVSIWNTKMRAFHYELSEEQRTLSAISSGFFNAHVFLYDQLKKEDIDFLKQAAGMNWQKSVPSFVIANSFEVDVNIDGIFKLKPEDLEDLPGILIRCITEEKYYHRSSKRKKVKTKSIMHLDGADYQIHFNNLSEDGLQFYSRKDLQEKTKTAVIFYKTQEGKALEIPIKMCWAKKLGDGRWLYGAKFLLSNNLN